MATTPNLALLLWAAQQAQPEVTVDDALNSLDVAITGTLTHNASADTDYTLSTSGAYPREHQYARIVMTDTGANWTQGRSLVVPDFEKLYVIHNNTGAGHQLLVTTSAGAGVSVVDGSHAFLYCDASSVFRVTADDGEADYRDVVFALTIAGASALPSQELMRLTMTHAVTFATSMVASQSKAGTAAAGASAIFSFKKNGIEFATAIFSATTVATWTGGATSLAIGDQLTIVAPTSTDAALSDVGISIVATRDK